MQNNRHLYLRQQLQFLREQYLQEGELSIQSVLSDELIKRAWTAIDGCWKDRIYTPMVTLWVFLRQVISADHSCRAAVSRLIVHRLSQGLTACSSRTGAYCQARKRLPEEFISSIARGVGEELESQTKDDWLWNGHRVYMFDGTTTLLPDTQENREAYPPPQNSKIRGVLPLMRIGAVFSLACGAVMDLAVAKYAGKGQGEVTLLRQLAKIFSKGDVLLADCLMCNWRNIHELQERGVHLVSRLNKALRKADFRKGKRLGKDDHVVQWPKPHIREVGREAQSAMPRKLAVREVRVRINQPGFRTKVIIIVTTLLDPNQYTKEDLADLYRQRWNNELDIRNIKSVMKMEHLRCKTPELVRKEIWTHMLAYNLTRTLMAQAAIENDVLPRSISFKATLQYLEAFQSFVLLNSHAETSIEQMHQQLLQAIAAHPVANRPDRIEPRRLKRRHKHYVPLAVPRDEAKQQIIKGLTKN